MKRAPSVAEVAAARSFRGQRKRQGLAAGFSRHWAASLNDAGNICFIAELAT